MDPNLIYTKTPTGDEAVRQSTRVVQRNLRMVLVLVDGKVSVAELAAKIGNSRLVESALRELEEGGYIAPTIEAVSVWEESRKAAQNDSPQSAAAVLSEFSTFGPKSLGGANSRIPQSAVSNFSSFGKPILPSSSRAPAPRIIAPPLNESQPEDTDFSTRKPRFTRLRLATICALVITATLMAIALLYPYDRFKQDIEANASLIANAPVTIDRVSLALLPSPHLKLTGIHIGIPVSGKIEEIRLSSPLSLLARAPHKISKIDISGAYFPASQLVSFPLFRGDPFGEGHIENAVFETADRSLLVTATPSTTGIELALEGRAWKPTGTSVVFASLQAKGVLQSQKLFIENIDTTFLGGILRGNWLLDWSNGLSMTGDGSLIRLDSRKISEEFIPSLKMEGDVTGTVRLRSRGDNWEALWRNVEALLSTEITRGVPGAGAG